MNLTQMLDYLDTLKSPATLGELKNALGQLEPGPDDLQQHLHFDSCTYQRNLLRKNENYEALILCFEAGQRTPIHDHAGSACGVKVLQGVGVETIFDTCSDGWIFATGSHELPANGVVGSNDMDIHQLSNLQTDGQPLVTLHIYSPPLGEVGNYCLEDNSIKYVTAAQRDTVATN